MLSNLVIWATALLASCVQCIDVDFDDNDSIYDACKLLSTGLMDYYWGDDYGGTIGMMTNPYYWWEAGGAWGGMIDYTVFFDNDTYTDTIIEAMMYQKGDDSNYMPLNQTTTEGNDDQVFWGIAAMEAAERNFTNPSDDEPGWLALAQAVFNTMAWRWDDSECGGGLRWQIFAWNSGYDYKNTISNAGLFHMAARLARYTGNDSYSDWGEEVYDWLVDVKFINEDGDTYYCYDGASIDDNCTVLDKLQWSYNAAMMVSGSAYLYNMTEDQIWLERTEGLLNGIFDVFFNSTDSIMYESACQNVGTCSNDQRSFKAYLSRFLGLTALMAPSTDDKIMTYLAASAQGAMQSCVGGTDGHTCGMDWSAVGWDGYYGLGEQMSALEVMQSLLIHDYPAPYTADDGGSSEGNAGAGSGATETEDTPLDLNTGDIVGASIVTAAVGLTAIGVAVFVLWG